MGLSTIYLLLFCFASFQEVTTISMKTGSDILAVKIEGINNQIIINASTLAAGRIDTCLVKSAGELSQNGIDRSVEIHTALPVESGTKQAVVIRQPGSNKLFNKTNY